MKKNELFFVTHKYSTEKHADAGEERDHNADGKNCKVTHFKRLPRLRMLGTQIPTKIACCRLRSVSPINHSVTLNTKLTKAAAKKKYLLMLPLGEKEHKMWFIPVAPPQGFS